MASYFVEPSECSRREIFPGVAIQAASGERMTMSLVEFQPGGIVELHQHPHEQMGMVLEGRAHFFVGDQDQVLGPGRMYRIPGGIPHRVVALDSAVKCLDFFAPVRDEYRSA